MSTNRLEAFSDGVLAIIITIMVLELKVPEGYDLNALKPLIPTFLAYLLSFIYIGIYWNNHHHLLHAAQRVNGTTLWFNLHLLFWLSLIPVTTHWLGEHHAEIYPVAIYGFVLLMASIAYYLLSLSLVKTEGKDSLLARSLGKDKTGKLSMGIYGVGIALTFVNTWIGVACYVLVAAIWFVPDKRIEKHLKQYEE